MDLYKILGVSSDATTAQIKTAYRALAKDVHPDKTDVDDSEHFIEIHKAYEILSNENKRKIYDQQGIAGVTIAEQERPPKESGHNQGQGQGQIYGQSYKIPPDNQIFNNIFSHFFPNNQMHPSTTNANTNANTSTETNKDHETTEPIKQRLIISPKEVCLGATKVLKYYRNLICQQCYGKGYKLHCQPVNCAICHGKGRVTVGSQIGMYQNSMVKDCTNCLGKGTISDEKNLCENCQGNKLIRTENHVDVTIHPGMNEKIKLKYENLGHEEPNKTAGDLIVELFIDNLTNYEIEGHNLRITQDISLAEALGGVNKNIQFIDGSTIRIMTDSNEVIQPNETKVYKGNGLPIYETKIGAKKYGDLFVQFNVKLPTKLTPTAKKQIIHLIEKNK